jgi:hypothetical protein
MCSTRWTLAIALCVVLAACSGKPGAETSDGGSRNYALTLVGGANLVLHPSDKRTLQVLLAQDQVGPVANANVHFEFQDGDPAGAKLDAQDVQTDQSGVATIHFTAGTSASGRPTYKLVASAPSYGPDPVAFSFNVIPVRRLLQIVGSPTTHVAADGLSATVTIGVNTSVGLKVRDLDADTGGAIAQDDLTFTLPPAAVSGGNLYWSGNTATATALTGAGGEAQAYLFTKSAASGPWQITALSAGGGAAVTFSVTVQNTAGSSCTTNSQCPTGQVCAGNPPVCQTGGGGGCNNGSDNPCPYGYICDPATNTCKPPANNQCDVNAPNCGSSQCCDPGSYTCKNICPSVCAAGQHCQPGAACGTGSCVSDITTPDVTGVWLTRHDYNVKKALPTALQDVFYAVRVLDQALLGKLTIPGLPSWLQAIINSFISKLLQNYLPDWLRTVIHISDDVVTVLSNLRSEGSMHLVKGVDYQHVSGTEVWTSLVFYWLPLCNGNIGGDPGVPPECARIDIATTDAQNPGEVGQCKGQSLPSITVQVAPFTGSVAGAGAGGAAPYSLSVNQRRVQLKMGKVLLALIDLIISYVTPYHCIDEITDCHAGPGNCPLVNCYGLSQDLAGPGTWLGGFIDPGSLEGLCDGVVTTSGQAVTQLLATVWSPTADVLDFSGHATVSGAVDSSACEGGSTSCAAKLGNDTWDKDLNSSNSATVNARDGNWTGDFFFKVIGKLPGSWEATRPQ